MRKVLLATTALVMAGGVSAAYADISVSGGHELKYQTWSKATSTTANNSKVSSSATYTISGSSVLDNGMTISGEVYGDGSGGAFDTQGFSISDDWGTIGVADMESGDAFATAIDITDDEAYDGAAASTINTYAPGDEYVANSTVSYLSPNISGFQFAVGMKDTTKYSDATSYGAQYAMTAGEATVTLKYAASNTGKTTSTATDEVDATSTAVVIGMAGATLTVAQNTADVGTSAKYENSGAAIAYTLSDALTVEAYSGEVENDKDADYKFKETAYGVTYTVTPGMTLSITHNSWDYVSNAAAANDGTNTAVALNVSF